MIYQDPEFGEVIVRKNALSTNVKISISTSGRLQITLPKYTPNFFIKRYLNEYREKIKKNLRPNDPKTQRSRDAKKKILTKKAKEYLPYRLDFWAKKYGYRYDKFRLSHAATRWGSCTRHAKGNSTTISLNVGLMQLPEVLRDYVILHELAHLNHMDHSPAFWREVGSHDPNYKNHRKKLRMFSPGV